MVYDQQMRSSTRLGIGGVIKVNKVSAVLTALLSGVNVLGISGCPPSTIFSGMKPMENLLSLSVSVELDQFQASNQCHESREESTEEIPACTTRLSLSERDPSYCWLPITVVIYVHRKSTSPALPRPHSRHGVPTPTLAFTESRVRVKEPARIYVHACFDVGSKFCIANREPCSEPYGIFTEHPSVLRMASNAIFHDAGAAPTVDRVRLATGPRR